MFVKNLKLPCFLFDLLFIEIDEEYQSTIWNYDWNVFFFKKIYKVEEKVSWFGKKKLTYLFW